MEIEYKPSVLVIDDTPENLSIINGLLKDRFAIKVANHGERGLDLARRQPLPDIILLDVMMPGIDGWEVCRRLKADPQTQDIPVIFLTASGDADHERKGLELGAVDYITKPINPPVLLARVNTHITLKASNDFLKDKASYLENEVAKRTRQIQDIKEVTVLALAALAETRDDDTGNHLRRTQHYVQELAEELRRHPRYVSLLTDAVIDQIFKSAPLHDIGKVGIPDRILLKPGKLDQEEFEVMKTHTSLGLDAINKAERQLGVDIEFLRTVKDIAYCHHEKWNGGGYPRGLAGEAIPLAARLMAVADVYDALISRRIYKPAFSHEDAVRIIQAERGKHFDPDIVDAFMARQEAFLAITRRFADGRA